MCINRTNCGISSQPQRVEDILVPVAKAFSGRRLPNWEDTVFGMQVDGVSDSNLMATADPNFFFGTNSSICIGIIKLRIGTIIKALGYNNLQEYLNDQGVRDVSGVLSGRCQQLIKAVNKSFIKAYFARGGDTMPGFIFDASGELKIEKERQYVRLGRNFELYNSKFEGSDDELLRLIDNESARQLITRSLYRKETKLPKFGGGSMSC